MKKEKKKKKTTFRKLNTDQWAKKFKGKPQELILY